MFIYLLSVDYVKNLGRLWLAYTELQGDFTCYKSYLLTPGCGLALTPVIIRKDHGQMLIESAQHSFAISAFCDIWGAENTKKPVKGPFRIYD